MPGSFHNQGEAETPVLGGDLSGGAEHGGLRFLKAVSISRWARERLQEAARRDGGKGSLDLFYGCISDNSFRAPKELPASSDSHRESFD